MANTTNTIFCAFFSLVGSILLIGSILLCYQTLQFIKNSILVTGEVIALRSGKYHPTIKFTSKEAEIVEYFQNGFNKGYEVGEKVNVLYIPGRAKEASVDSFWVLWGLNIVIFIVGIAFLIVGVYKFFYPNSQWIEWNI